MTILFILVIPLCFWIFTFSLHYLLDRLHGYSQLNFHISFWISFFIVIIGILIIRSQPQSTWTQRGELLYSMPLELMGSNGDTCTDSVYMQVIDDKYAFHVAGDSYVSHANTNECVVHYIEEGDKAHVDCFDVEWKKWVSWFFKQDLLSQHEYELYVPTRKQGLRDKESQKN